MAEVRGNGRPPVYQKLKQRTMTTQMTQTGQSENAALMQTVQKKKTLYEILTSDEVKNSLAEVSRGLMTGERLAGILWQCCQKTPELMKCTPMSLISATKTLIQLGCEPDGVHGFLVPFNTKKKRKGENGQWIETWEMTVTPVPSARGLMRMARSNGVQNLNTGIVREGEPFQWVIENGNFAMSHMPGWGNSTAKVIGYYCTWTDREGKLHGERMADEEIKAIKARSKSKDKEGNVVGPWVDYHNQMALKTVIKRASKMWDLPYEFQVAMQEADEAEFGGNSLRDVTPRKNITGLMDSLPKPFLPPAAEEAQEPEGDDYATKEEAWGEEPKPEQREELPL